MESWREELYRDELYHHGIKGQKWGVRRFQNEDGTLTPEGQKRYNENKLPYSVLENYRNANVAEKEGERDSNGNKTELWYENDEKLRREYKDLAAHVNKGALVTKEVLSTIGSITLMTASATALAAGGIMNSLPLIALSIPLTIATAGTTTAADNARADLDHLKQQENRDIDKEMKSIRAYDKAYEEYVKELNK